VKPVLKLMESVAVHEVSHITGGGFYENIPRCLPDGLRAKIDRSKVRVLPIFDLLAKEGNIPERDMFNTFNMGVGMALVVPAAQAEKALDILKGEGQEAYVMGEIISGEKGVELC
jgi:phosphoribosylformylglycinamidine cyclo-ligase